MTTVLPNNQRVATDFCSLALSGHDAPLARCTSTNGFTATSARSMGAREGELFGVRFAGIERRMEVSKSKNPIIRYFENRSYRRKIDKNFNEQLKKLKMQGHKCVIIRETYPPSIFCCGQEICTGKNEF